MRFAAVVSMDDVLNYFKGSTWRTTVRDGAFIGWSDTAEVELRPASPKFRLHVESVDDPSDAEDFVTEKPMKELAAFLGQDIPGGEHFERMSSATPERAARALAALAAMIERDEIGPRLLARRLRILSVPVAGRVAEQKDQEAGFISKLRSDMEAKGWRVKQEEDDRGLPLLRVDISGIYEATVAVEELTWDFKFEVTGAPDTVRKGKTGDPIAEYRRYYKDPDVAEAAREARAARSRKTQESQDEATNAPRRRAPEDSGEAETGRIPETGRPAA